MNKLSRYFKNYDTLLASAAGFYIIYLYTRYSGIGISPDSIMYTSAARSFNEHGTLITFNSKPINDFPVFYPIFLGLMLLITHADPFVAGPVLNGLLYGGVIYASGWIMQRFYSPSRIYKWLIFIAIVLSPALLQVYTYLWSETLFILLILLSFIAFRRYLENPSLTTLLPAAIITGISCITRYAGLPVIGMGCLLILLDLSLSVKKRINHILIFGAAASSLLTANLIVNAFLTGTSTGPRETSFTPFATNVYYFGTVICDWIGLTGKQYGYATPLAIAIIIGLTIALAYNVVKNKLNSFENIAVTFSLVYILFIIISSTFSRYERINNRLMSPVFIPLIWGCTSWILKAVRGLKLYKKLIIAAIFSTIMLSFSYAELKADLDRQESEDGYGIPGYSDDSWNKSAFAAYLEKEGKHAFKPDTPIYSDANEALYFLSGMSTRLIPHKYFKTKIDTFYKQKRFYLVWFNAMANPELIDIKDIMAHKKLTPVKVFKEGGIYLCEER